MRKKPPVMFTTIRNKHEKANLVLVTLFSIIALLLPWAASLINIEALTTISVVATKLYFSVIAIYIWWSYRARIDAIGLVYNLRWYYAVSLLISISLIAFNIGIRVEDSFMRAISFCGCGWLLVRIIGRWGRTFFVSIIEFIRLRILR